jgi:hypothetical protein
MTEPPVWGSPHPAPTPPTVSPAEPGAGGYYLVIEQVTGSADSAVWRIDPEPMWVGPTRDQARAAARKAAQEFRPRHPFSERGRAAYRVDDDNLIVHLQGATKNFHFRITVVERLF